MTLIDPEDYKNAPDGDNIYAAIKVKTPKRILHFSDGILEEYSDDEVDSSSVENKAVVDYSSLPWGPWAWYKLWSAGYTTVSCLDAAGEFMASFFGITTPKYYFELEEYKRKQQQLVQENLEKKGWSQSAGSFNNQDIEFTDIRTSQPMAV